MTIIRHKYEGQLGELIKDIRHLGLRVYFNLEHALVSLSEDDKNYARQVIENDKDINNLDYDINEKVIMLITKQQMIATDLRMMMAALKISTDFERMGDNAKTHSSYSSSSKDYRSLCINSIKNDGEISNANVARS